MPWEPCGIWGLIFSTCGGKAAVDDARAAITDTKFFDENEMCIVGDWREKVPVDIKLIWDGLSEESRAVAYYFADSAFMSSIQ
jgi:hypothetical protein